MKKTYMKPEMAMENVVMEQTIMAGSGGVETVGSVGNAYNGEDVSYGDSNSSLWDDEEE